MSSILRVAAIQMTSGTSWTDNLKSATDLVGLAHEAGAQVVLLPEYFCLMGQQDDDKVKIREAFAQGPIQDAMSQLAQEHGVYLVSGTIPLLAEQTNKVRNSSLVFDPCGKIIARYDKIHLFGFHHEKEHYDESSTIEAGSEVCRFEIEIAGQAWSFGLSICYDLRFPELYRQLGAVDCHLIPAAFTYTTGKAHWETLLKARAIENQCYVLASGQSGKHQNGRNTWGQSILIDPWGNTVDELKDGYGIVCADLDKNLISEIRSKLPALQHRVL